MQVFHLKTFGICEVGPKAYTGEGRNEEVINQQNCTSGFLSEKLQLLAGIDPKIGMTAD